MESTISHYRLYPPRIYSILLSFRMHVHYHQVALYTRTTGYVFLHDNWYHRFWWRFGDGFDIRISALRRAASCCRCHLTSSPCNLTHPLSSQILFLLNEIADNPDCGLEEQPHSEFVRGSILPKALVILQSISFLSFCH